MDLAYGYALGILDADEQREVERLRAGLDPRALDEFEVLVRQTRETLAAVGSATVATPSPGLRQRVLDSVAMDGAARLDGAGSLDDRSFDGVEAQPISLSERREKKAARWKVAGASIAAAVALLAGGVFIGHQFTGASSTSTADQVVAAADVRAANFPVAAGGNATAVFSKDKDAAILFLDGVAPPKTGSVYQMWFIEGTNAPVSAGIIDAAQVTPGSSTVVRGLGNAGTLALSVEPSGGSPQPTTSPFVALDLA